MAIDFKNIVFKYIKITGGTASIDTLMTDKIFDATKPKGVYKCFTFPKNHWAGYDYKDVQNLISIEESEMWDKINRDTFLGFNEETKEFIVNYNAWLSLKDADLKTDGELPHPSQAGWYITTLSITKDADSKFELDQTAGSKVYLTIKPYTTVPVSTSYSYKVTVYPASCVENNKKSVVNSPLFKKNESLFAKCSTDNSVIMVNNCVLKLLVKDFSDNPHYYDLSQNKKEYGYENTVRLVHTFSSSYRFGKTVFAFDDATSINPILNGEIFLKNKTSSTDIELTYTNNLEDILVSGESLTFYTVLKSKVCGYLYDKTNSKPYEYIDFFDVNQRSFKPITSGTSLTFSSYENKLQEGVSCDLISLDSRKPFMYEQDAYNISINGIGGKLGLSFTAKVSDIIKNIPDGFIFIVSTDKLMLRYKKGDSIKSKSKGGEKYVVISETTQFGNEIYGDNRKNPIPTITISKDDIVNSTGFTDVTPDVLSSLVPTSFYRGFLITVYKI